MLFQKLAGKLKNKLLSNRVSMLGAFDQEMIDKKKDEVKDKLKEQYKKRRMF